MKMHPRLVVGPATKGLLDLPATAGGVTIWARREAPVLVGDGRTSVEYRTPSGLPIVVVTLRAGAGRAAAMVFLPVRDDADDDSAVSDELATVRAALVRSGAILGQVPVSKDGSFDLAAEPRLATLWPAEWKARDAKDVLPDPRKGIPGDAPSGPPTLGLRLA